MGEELHIQGGEVEIRLEVLGYENSKALNPEGRIWLNSNLEVKAGPFRGTIKLSLTNFELAALGDKIAAKLAALEDNVSFESMEANWSLDIAFQRTGAAKVSGKVVPNPAEGNVLHYEFVTDPISLEAFTQDIRRIVTRFPVA